MGEGGASGLESSHTGSSAAATLVERDTNEDSGSDMVSNTGERTRAEQRFVKGCNPVNNALIKVSFRFLQVLSVPSQTGLGIQCLPGRYIASNRGRDTKHTSSATSISPRNWTNVSRLEGSTLRLDGVKGRRGFIVCMLTTYDV